MMMITMMTALIMCLATSEFGKSSENTYLGNSDFTFWKDSKLLNGMDLVSHEEGNLKLGKCENMEKG